LTTNVLKCRRPQNRDPMPHEAETCLPYLRMQFKLIQPKAVLVLGRHALERMLPGVGPISKVHGEFFMRSGVAFMPCYHPAAALHNGGLLNDLQRDFDRVRSYLDRMLAPPEPEPEPTPPHTSGTPPEATEQLSLLLAPQRCPTSRWAGWVRSASICGPCSLRGRSSSSMR